MEVFIDIKICINLVQVCYLAQEVIHLKTGRLITLSTSAHITRLNIFRPPSAVVGCLAVSCLSPVLPHLLLKSQDDRTCRWSTWPNYTLLATRVLAGLSPHLSLFQGPNRSIFVQWWLGQFICWKSPLRSWKSELNFHAKFPMATKFSKYKTTQLFLQPQAGSLFGQNTLSTTNLTRTTQSEAGFKQIQGQVLSTLTRLKFLKVRLSSVYSVSMKLLTGPGSTDFCFLISSCNFVDILYTFQLRLKDRATLESTTSPVRARCQKTDPSPHWRCCRV